jgi:hypothetical protein
MTNFEDILNQRADEVLPPPVLPVGTYNTIVSGLPEMGQSSKKQTNFYKFSHTITSPGDDVDGDALEESFPDGVAGKVVANTLYLTDASLFMLTDFLKNCGIDLTGKSIRACVEEVPNCAVRIQIKHESSDDGQRIFAKVARTLPAED